MSKTNGMRFDATIVTARMWRAMLLALAMLLAAMPAAMAQDYDDEDDDDEEEWEEVQQADTVAIFSTAMNRDIKAVVIVPEEYFDDEAVDEVYPVLYLLHGATGCYSDWPRKADLDGIASENQMIIVCPDGQDSWYWDSPLDPSMQFETFISRELVNYIDTHYRTIKNPKLRAITGLSMGGHGALWNAFRHPDVFGSCGSMSGGVDIVPFPDRWHIIERIGRQEDNLEAWQSHSVINLVPTLRPGQNIIIDDGIDDIFIKQNIALHDALVAQKIPHDFIVRPGNHSWTYWVNSLDYQVLYFSKVFEAALEQ